MGILLEAVRRAWSHRKLHLGQCEACGGILPDVHQRGDTTCSDACADDAWLYQRA